MLVGDDAGRGELFVRPQRDQQRERTDMHISSTSTGVRCAGPSPTTQSLPNPWVVYNAGGNSAITNLAFGFSMFNVGIESMGLGTTLIGGGTLAAPFTIISAVGVPGGVVLFLGGLWSASSGAYLLGYGFGQIIRGDF